MVSVVTNDQGVVLMETHTTGGSSNIAELIAVREALTWCARQQIPDVRVFTDSRNNFAWTYGKKLGKKLNDRDRVVALRREIDELRQRVNLALVWIGRDQNLAGHYIERTYHL